MVKRKHELIDQKERECIKCHEMKNIDTCFNGGRNMCRTCRNNFRKEYRQTVDGALRDLLLDSKKSSKRRRKKGRVFTNEYSLTFEDLKHIYQQQNGTCFYFKTKQMSLLTSSEFHMSLERIDPYKDYCKENVVLCCEEFNGRRTWNQEKIKFCHQIYLTPDSQPKYEEQKFLDLIKQPPVKKRVKKCKCTDLLHTQKGKNGRCITCKKIYHAMKGKTPFYFIKNLFAHCKGNSLERISKKNREYEDHTMTLTFEDIINMHKNQEGKCVYSGINMIMQPDSDWQLSIERLDNKKGYTKENCCLVCLEFNTPSQWSKDKFQAWMKSL